MLTEHEKKWNPYVAGALAGLLLVASVWFTGRFFGASTTYVRFAGMLEELFSVAHVASLDYFAKEKPIIDWQGTFVIGIFTGSFFASLLSGTFLLVPVPRLWSEFCGNSTVKRAVYAFVGGVIALFGARLAGGCPSGHGLSGASQLAVSGLVALVCFFIGGVVTAAVFYRRR